MSIKNWPQQERPREKLLSKGVEALSDAELLAIFLRTGVSGKSAVDLARDLLQEFSGLGGIFAADQQRFCQAHGMGIAKYVQLQAVLEMSRRYLLETPIKSEAFTNPQQVGDFLTLKMRGLQHEVFACVFLDNKHRLIAYRELFSGSISSASVHPREVVKACLSCNAAAVILAHNHPSGIAEPSDSDRLITERLIAALQLIDVRVLDHLVVGESKPVSFAARGWV